MKLFLILIFLFLSIPLNLWSSNETQVNKQEVTPIDHNILVKIVKRTEINFKIPKNMLHTLILMESNYNILATNLKDKKRSVSVTSYGLGQITENTAKALCGYNLDDLYDAKKNILCSAKIVKYQLKRFNYDIPKTVAAYNAGTPCICGGAYYSRSMGNLKKVIEETCYRNKKIKVNKKIVYKNIDASCSPIELGKFLNQNYVDKFFSLWEK